LPSILLENEKLLLKQVVSGNEEAFAKLFHAYRDKLFSFMYRISGSKEIAEDIVQDVFLKIWLQRENLLNIENFNAFLFRMSQNHVINQLRRRSKETLILLEKQKSGYAIPSTADEQMHYKNIRQLLEKIIEELPTQQKTVYLLSREQSLKQEEIATQMNISVSTVKNHMTQALKTIREKLRRYLA
jgi:RNA polymerase sigma-70 factor (ECF subfamily)